MRFNCKPATNKEEWHEWFAWFPVSVGDQCIWWEKVERKGTYVWPTDMVCTPGDYYDFDYRRKEE